MCSSYAPYDQDLHVCRLTHTRYTVPHTIHDPNQVVCSMVQVMLKIKEYRI